jgi:hypothetical protein
VDDELQVIIIIIIIIIIIKKRHIIDPIVTYDLLGTLFCDKAVQLWYVQWERRGMVTPIINHDNEGRRDCARIQTNLDRMMEASGRFELRVDRSRNNRQVTYEPCEDSIAQSKPETAHKSVARGRHRFLHVTI